MNKREEWQKELAELKVEVRKVFTDNSKPRFRRYIRALKRNIEGWDEAKKDTKKKIEELFEWIENNHTGTIQEKDAQCFVPCQQLQVKIKELFSDKKKDELSKESVEKIEKARKRIKKGNFLTEKQERQRLVLERKQRLNKK